jgi:ComEC/Rec2-related protein
MTELQRFVATFATLFVLGVAAGLEYSSLPASELALPVGLAVAGTLGGALYARGFHRRMAYLAFALGGFSAGYARVCWELDTSSPNHLDHFARERGYREDDQPPLFTEVYGCIAEDPDVRSGGSTILTVQPVFLVELDENRRPVRKVPVTRGRVQIRTTPQLGDDPYIQQLAYGDLVVAREAELLRPPVPDNPGAYDDRAHQRSLGVYATLELRDAVQLRKISESDATALGLASCTNPVSDFALFLRKRFTAAIKHTVPFPESSFLGGVLLGLRGGMDRTAYSKLQEPFLDEKLSPWQKLKRAFGPWSIQPGVVPTNAVAVYQATGTAHILAVSGLHVGIVAALLFGLLATLRFPRFGMAFVIVPGIWIFAILVGFRPSTIRAATMTSIVAISYSIFGSGLRASSLFGLSVAAVVVLWLFPVAVTEAAVTYSFGAILSLALLTGPFDYYLRRSVRSLLGYAVLLLAYTVLCLAVMGRLDEWPPHWTLLACLGLTGAGLLARRRLPLDLSLARLPRPVVLFFAAQLAILAGLVFPLNSYYFHQLPVSSPLGNMIALPGLTVIIFVAMLAALLFQVPMIGPPAALLLMAGAWFFIRYVFFPPLVVLFWLVPWPAFREPSLGELLAYYAMLAALAWHQDIGALLRRLRFRLSDLVRAPRLARSLGLAGGLAGIAALAVLLGLLQPHQGPLRLSVLQPYSLGRGGGHPILVEAPWGEVVLVDGGPRTIPNRMNKRALVSFDVGERVVASVLLGKRLSHIDTVVVTNFRKENVGGLLHILEHFDVERVVDPLGPDPAFTVLHPFQPARYEAFLKVLGDEDLVRDKLSIATMALYEDYGTYREICARRGIPIVRAAAGMELLHPGRPEEQRLAALAAFLAVAVLAALGCWIVFRRKLFLLRATDLVVIGLLVVLLGLLAVVRAGQSEPGASLRVLAPLEAKPGPGALESNSLVLRLDGQGFSALLPSDLQAAGQEALLHSVPPEALRAQVLVIPDRTRPEALHEPFVAAVAPRTAIGVVQRDRFNRQATGHVLDAYRKSGAQVYATDVDGAVVLETDRSGTTSVHAFHSSAP